MSASGKRRAWPASLHLVLFGIIIAVPLLVLLILFMLWPYLRYYTFLLTR